MPPSSNSSLGFDGSKLQPKFKECKFDSSRKEADLLKWISLIGNIIYNIGRGCELEWFLDSFLERTTTTTTQPAFLQHPALDLSGAKSKGEGASLTSGPLGPPNSTLETIDEDGGEVFGDALSGEEERVEITQYCDLSSQAMELDKLLFHTLQSIISGPLADVIADLTGHNARYTFAIIGLWKHAELGSTSRRLNAMTEMESLTFNGDAGKWKLNFIEKAREIYASKVTIEHYIMQCAFKSFEGKNTQVQGMIATDINSDKVKPGMSLDEPLRWHGRPRSHPQGRGYVWHQQDHRFKRDAVERAAQLGAAMPALKSHRYTT